MEEDRELPWSGPVCPTCGRELDIEPLATEKYYFKVRALGHDIVTDYHRDELGIMGGQRGARIVDGKYVCPGMPKKLINANADFEASKKETVDEAKAAGSWLMPDAHRAAEETRALLLEESAKYQFRQKEKADEHGSVKMICPAYGPGATAICPWREQHPGSSKLDKAEIITLPKAKDACCTNASVTMEVTRESRYLQKYQYKSPKWKRTYEVDRNAVESFNAYIKDDGKENLGATGSRRLRGLAAQQFMVTFLVVSANMRKIFKFRQDMTKTERQRTPRVPRFRGSNSLKHYRPKTAEVREQWGLEPLQTPMRV